MRVWTNPSEIFVRLLAHTDRELITAKPSETDLEEVADTLRQGGTPPPRSKVIPFDEIRSLEINEKNHTIEWKLLKGEGEFDASSRIEREEIFESLREALGADFEETRKAVAPQEAVLKPLLVTLVLVGLTWGLYYLASQPEAGDEIRGRHGIFKRLFVGVAEILGPAGSLIFGGLLVIGCLYYGFKRFTDPPVYRTLKRRS